MSKDSIELHPKYGVNPTMGVCAYCGEEDGTIGLLGFNKGKEAPKHTVLSLEPCKKCKEHMSKGITFVAVKSEQEPIPMKWCIVRREAAEKMLKDDTLKQSILDKGVCNMSVDTYDKIFPEEVLESADQLL